MRSKVEDRLRIGSTFPDRASAITTTYREPERQYVRWTSPLCSRLLVIDPVCRSRCHTNLLDQWASGPDGLRLAHHALTLPGGHGSGSANNSAELAIPIDAAGTSKRVMSRREAIWSARPLIEKIGMASRNDTLVDYRQPEQAAMSIEHTGAPGSRYVVVMARPGPAELINAGDDLHFGPHRATVE